MVEGYDRRAWRAQRDLELQAQREAWTALRARIRDAADPFHRERTRIMNERELNPGIRPRHATGLFTDDDTAVQVHPEQGTDGTYGRRFPGTGVYNESAALPDTI